MKTTSPLKFASLMLLGSVSWAAPLTFSFTSSLLPAIPGMTVTFSATLTNTEGTTLFLNGDNFNLAPPLILNDLKFFLNVPASLGPGQTIMAQIFDVVVPVTAPLGLYVGNFDILGGNDASAQGLLTTQNFGVNAVPEPATAGLLLGSLGAILLLRKWASSN